MEVDDFLLDGVVWEADIEASIRSLPRSAPPQSPSSSATPLPIPPPVQLDESHFTYEANSSRYTIKNTTLRHLTMFPWLQKKEKGTHKEVLKPPSSFARVLEALNYFLSETYTERDVQFLLDYYRSLQPPVKNPLTKVIELQQEFQRQRLLLELEGLLFPFSLSLSLAPSHLSSFSRFEVNSIQSP
jgi:hypothetical protein